jgi:hypothetical protein
MCAFYCTCYHTAVVHVSVLSACSSKFVPAAVAHFCESETPQNLCQAASPICRKNVAVFAFPLEKSHYCNLKDRTLISMLKLVWKSMPYIWKSVPSLPQNMRPICALNFMLFLM